MAITLKQYHELVGGDQVTRPGSEKPEPINAALVAEYIANKAPARVAILARYRALRGLPQSEG